MPCPICWQPVFWDGSILLSWWTSEFGFQGFVCNRRQARAQWLKFFMWLNCVFLHLRFPYQSLLMPYGWSKTEKGNIFHCRYQKRVLYSSTYFNGRKYRLLRMTKLLYLFLEVPSMRVRTTKVVCYYECLIFTKALHLSGLVHFSFDYPCTTQITNRTIVLCLSNWESWKLSKWNSMKYVNLG